ncbi:MAG: hypothetical protein MH472_05470, partial [Bacteroidia bacterium]|nr:hypothetical protein [Bacteroidia bacterium]
MDSIIKRIIMVIFHIFPLTLPAQTFEWLNNTKSILGESFTGASMDSSGTIAVVGNFQRELLFNNDTLRFTNNINSAFVCKYYSDSRLAWVKAFQNCNFEKVVSQNNGDIIVFGSARDTLHTTLGSIIASNTNRTSFLLKFDSVGLLIGMKALGFNSNAVSILNVKLDPFGNVNLLGYYSSNFFVLGTLITKSTNISDGVIIKISSDFESIQQIKTATNCSFTDAAFDNQQNIYLIGTLSSNTNSSIFDSYNFIPNNSDVILCKINSLNTFSWVKRFGGASSDRGESIIVNNQKIYFCGSFINSSIFSQISLTSNPSGKQNGFIGIADTSGNIESIRQGFNNCAFINIGLAKNGNLMLMGTFNDSFKYDGFNLYSPISNCIFIAKLDPQLNGLWFLSLNFNGAVSSVLSSPNFEIYFSGTMYTNSMQFGPFYRFFNTINNNGFLVKLSDNYIKIKDPHSHQLCTHDSIQIPYTSYGK